MKFNLESPRIKKEKERTLRRKLRHPRRFKKNLVIFEKYIFNFLDGLDSEEIELNFNGGQYDEHVAPLGDVNVLEEYHSGEENHFEDDGENHL